MLLAFFDQTFAKKGVRFVNLGFFVRSLLVSLERTLFNQESLFSGLVSHPSELRTDLWRAGSREILGTCVVTTELEAEAQLLTSILSRGGRYLECHGDLHTD